MIELDSVREMRRWSRARRAEGGRVGFVPTMGALHEGHLRLVDRARARADATVMSVFVNPLQFGPHEDFARYPRDLARDRDLAERRGVNCLFVPGAAEMYPTTPVVRVIPGPLADHLCGPRRPGHFEGVLTVVAKLFHAVEPDVAVFGRKDVQQARMIRCMAADLDFPVEIEVAPTVRESDGLAMSSRNTYLSAADRVRARRIPEALEAAHARFRSGLASAAALCQVVRNALAEDPAIRIEYIEAVDPDALAPVETGGADTVLALAVHIGATRLIDNVALGDGLAGDPRVP